ncbi:lipopolysaccharide biosynthesis protein [Pseudoneobacillus rhizosphaerae]|uniref:Teichuronic acid biosynthesis protein TuaB n=1 Tax=Pseudoneobacillus rhizosphaerae TaxID=2880968 RepID=A0A9C7G698_9BACI|nr:lipopolysaccharide biosynthesis protein [Pseudoneobacillus rhizosphaerae]CAG9606584.1 Teichuronic acid biosynthesis protein TuaB [Pseudoneobacillus rhizosphaerae]
MKLYEELKHGIVISAIGKYSNTIIQFLILAILSRLLTPSEFGVVAIINVCLVFFNMLIDMGIGPAIIQNKTLNNYQINSIFSFSIFISILLSILFALMSKPISLFYNNTDLFGVCLVMSIALFTSGINMVPISINLKQKKFLKVNFAQVISSIISGIIGIILAFNHFSFYALVISSIVKNLTMFIITFHKSNLKLTTDIKKVDLLVIYSFTRNQFLFNLINYFSRNLDNILIGKFISLKALAFYDKAYMLSLYPNQMLTGVITSVIQPIMSEYEDQKEIIKKTYITISKLLAIVGMPLTVFLYFSSKEIIYIIFGPQWAESVVPFQILAISIWIQMILSSTGSIFQSANRTDLLLKTGIVNTAQNILCIVIGVWTGRIEYVAALIVISLSVNFIIANYFLMNKLFKTRQIEFYKILISPIVISLILLVPLLIINLLKLQYSLPILFIFKGLLSLLLYLLGLKLTGNMILVKKILKRRNA